MKPGKSASKMLLEQCTILQDGREVSRDIVIADGKITKVCDRYAGNSERTLSSSPITKKINVQGRHVLPGVIDSHVHLREPGLTHKEDFRTGSMAAAAGGITTFIDMPNTLPPTTSCDALEEKRRLARASIVNYGFHFGTRGDNMDDIRRAENIASVKIYMNDTTGMLVLKDSKALERIFDCAKRITVHAEDTAMDKAIDLALKYNKCLYIAHVSSKYEIELLRRRKHLGHIFAEATPHHIFLSTEDKKDSFLEVKPSLKTPADRDAVFQAVQDGIIDTIATDHAPHTVEEKSAAFVYGIPGLETMLPLLLNQVHRGNMSLAQVQRLCSEAPANIFAIRGKGYIQEGYDADLTIIDFALRRKVDVTNFYSKCKWSPYVGTTLCGWPIMTIVNGNIVFDGKAHKNQGEEVMFDE